MSRSEGLPITVCPSFCPVLICQSAGTDSWYSIFGAEQATSLLFVVDRTYKFDSHGRQDWSLSDGDFDFHHQTPAITASLILTHGPWSSPWSSHHTSLLLSECFLRLFIPESDDPAMIWEAGEWTIPNFPPSSLSSFSCRSQTLRSRILFLTAIPAFCLSIKQTLSRSLSRLCQNKQLEHLYCKYLGESNIRQKWKLEPCDRCQCRGKRGRRNLIAASPLPAAIVSCANVEISENKKRVLQCQYWRQSAQSNKTGKLREGRQNGKGDLKTHSFVSWKLDMRSKLCSIWIQTVEYSQFYQLVLCKWDTLFLSDTRLYECFSWLICFVSTFQFQFGEKQTDIYGWILHTTVCVIEMFCELIGEICNSAPGQFAGPCCVRRRRAWHRVWPPHQTSHSMSGSFETFGMIFWNNSSSSFCLNM